MNPAGTGTKAAAHYRLTSSPADGHGASPAWDPPATGRPTTATATGRRAAGPRDELGVEVDAMADAPRRGRRLLRHRHPGLARCGRRRTSIRQALAGMLWSKQYYYYDVDRWLEERGVGRLLARTSAASHATSSGTTSYNADIISMPDKWEYPWYAAWDLAFHVLAAHAGRRGLRQGPARASCCATQYLHPSGQIPAYEWNFGDVNPPVHAWATIFTYRLEQGRTRRG